MRSSINNADPSTQKDLRDLPFRRNWQTAQKSTQGSRDRCQPRLPDLHFRADKEVPLVLASSPTYLLLKEMFAYLRTPTILEQEFPLIKSEDRFEENWMTLHMQILKARLVLSERLRTSSDSGPRLSTSWNSKSSTTTPRPTFSTSIPAMCTPTCQPSASDSTTRSHT